MTDSESRHVSVASVCWNHEKDIDLIVCYVAEVNTFFLQRCNEIEYVAVLHSYASRAVRGISQHPCTNSHMI